MKLLYCARCLDVFSLREDETRYCSCGKTSGGYVDSVNAVYSGEYAKPLGFENHSFFEARLNQPKHDTGKGVEFTAFVIAEDCPTFRKED